MIGRNGDVVLIAPQIEVGKEALVQAPNGATLLLAGQKVELTGRGLEGIRLELQAPDDRAVNLGTLQGDAVGIFAGQLKHSGLIQATGISAEGGRVVLKGQASANVDGTITASQGDKGGQVHVTADRVFLGDGAAIDVSGRNGGGEGLIGGGWQGNDSRIANALETTVAAGATIKADATENGDGGTVVAWSHDATRVYGFLSARGGAASGDGGNIETSGHSLDMQGRVDTRAAHGKTGNLLLDPTDIYIANDQASATAAGMTTTDNTADTSVPPTFQASGTIGPTPGPTPVPGPASTDSLLTTGTLTSALASSNVTVTTTSDGSGAGFIKVVNGISWSKATELALNATTDIIVDASIVNSTLPGSVRMNAGGSIAINAGITTASGPINLNAVGSVNVGAPIDAGASGAVSIIGQALDVTSALISGGSIALSTTDPGGSITLTGASLTAQTGAIQLRAAASTVNVSNSSLTSAGGPITIEGGYVTPAASGADAVSLNNATVDSGSGSIFINGTTQDCCAYGVKIAGNTVLKAAGGIIVTGEQSTPFPDGGGGVIIDTGSLTGSGPLTLNGITDTWSSAIALNSATIDRTGPVTLNGSSTGAGRGVDAFDSSISTAGSPLVINGSDSGVYLSGTAMTTGGATANLTSAAGVTLDSTSTLNTAGGEIVIQADSVQVDGLVNSGAGRTMFLPSTLTRPISLGGSDEINKLTLTATELNNVTAGVIVVGGSSMTGGITIDTPFGSPAPIAITSPALSLIQGGTASITQDVAAPLTVSQLNADAGGKVELTAANTVSIISGRARDPAGFVLNNTGFLVSWDCGRHPRHPIGQWRVTRAGLAERKRRRHQPIRRCHGLTAPPGRRRRHPAEQSRQQRNRHRCRREPDLGQHFAGQRQYRHDIADRERRGRVLLQRRRVGHGPIGHRRKRLDR